MSNEMHIDAHIVQSVFRECLAQHSDIISDLIVDTKSVEGIREWFEFNTLRLEQNRPQIIEWLNQLPLQFHKYPKGGGGWTYLNGCMEADMEYQWGEQPDVEKLFVLGMGLGLASYAMPHSMWKDLPGFPYYVIDTE